MKFPVLQEVFTLNVSINTSMSKEISGQLTIVLGNTFPTYLSKRSADQNIAMKRMMGCRQIGYINAVTNKLNNITPCPSAGLQLFSDSFHSKKNSFVRILWSWLYPA
jgi:hypothetical protein